MRLIRANYFEVFRGVLSGLKPHLGMKSDFCYPSSDKRTEREDEAHELSLLCGIYDPEASEENETWFPDILLPNVPPTQIPMDRTLGASISFFQKLLVECGSPLFSFVPSMASPSMLKAICG